MITPEIFRDLLILCLAWEWQEAERRYLDAAMDGTRHPHKTGWTTVDKVVRILHGLEVLTDKQRKKLYVDRRTQYAVSRAVEVCAEGVDLFDKLERSTKYLLVRTSEPHNLSRAKLLRNARLFATSAGLRWVETLEARHASVITKERYLGEIERQHALLPERANARAAMMRNYSKTVARDLEE